VFRDVVVRHFAVSVRLDCILLRCMAGLHVFKTPESNVVASEVSKESTAFISTSFMIAALVYSRTMRLREASSEES